MRLNKYLNEKRQEAPKIKKLYNKFNKELFNNELPEDISITWMNAKDKIGSTRAVKDRKTGEVEIKSLAISKNFQMTEDQLKGILVHEMVHIYMDTQVSIKASHGFKFKAMIENLQKKVDFEIPETETTMLQRLQSIMKPTPIIIGKSNRGQYIIIAFANKTWKDNKDEILKNLKLSKFEDGTLFYGKATDEIIEDVPKQRKVIGFNSYKIDKEEYERIKFKLKGKT